VFTLAVKFNSNFFGPKLMEINRKLYSARQPDTDYLIPRELNERIYQHSDVMWQRLFDARRILAEGKLSSGPGRLHHEQKHQPRFLYQRRASKATLWGCNIY
jgi:hypothetical protein